MVNAATFAVAAAVATTAFAAPALEARRRGGRGVSRAPQSSRTDKIAAGIGAAQLATDVVGLALPKRDLEFVEVEARRRRVAGSRGSALRSGGGSRIHVVTDQPDVMRRDFEELEARRRRAGGRSGPRSSTTDKITAGIGAAQLATDVAGLVIPKDVESADFEARDFSDDELETRDFEDLEARRFKVKTLNFGKGKRDLDLEDLEARDFSDDELEARDFEELEARRRRAGGRSGPRSSTTAKIQAGIDGAQLATDVAGLVIPKRDLEFVEVEARRRRGARGGAVGRPGSRIGPAVEGVARPAVLQRDFEELEARRRRAGGRSGPRSSTTAKIQAGIDGAQLATDVAGLVIPKRDLQFVEVEARRRRVAGSRGGALRSGGGSRIHVVTDQPDVMRRDFEELEARRRRAGGARRGSARLAVENGQVGTGGGQMAPGLIGLAARDFEDLEARRRRAGGRSGPRSSTTDKIQAGVDAAGLATSVAGLVMPKRDLEFVDVEARRRRGADSRGGALRSGGASTHVARPGVIRLEARGRRAGGARRGPRSSTTDKISAGIGAAQLATDVAGLVTAREFDLEMLD